MLEALNNFISGTANSVSPRRAGESFDTDVENYLLLNTCISYNLTEGRRL